MRTDSCWSHCSQVSVTISQTQLLLFPPPTRWHHHSCSGTKQKSGASLLFVLSISTPTTPFTHSVIHHVLSVLPSNLSCGYLLMFTLLTLPSFQYPASLAWAVEVASFLVFLPLVLLSFSLFSTAWMISNAHYVNVFKSFSESSWPTTVPFKHF